MSIAACNSQASENIVSDTTENLYRIFAKQKKAYKNNPFPDFNARKNNLLKLESILKNNQDPFCDTLASIIFTKEDLR